MVDYKARIEKAIEAHVSWIRRLRMALKTGMSQYQPAVVKSDRDCELGQWLFEDFPEHWKSTPLYGEILKLHADFHALAGNILELATSGRRNEAESAMEPSSRFAQQSLALIAKLYSLEEQT